MSAEENRAEQNKAIVGQREGGGTHTGEALDDGGTVLRRLGPLTAASGA